MYQDTRPRVQYRFPDGRPATIILHHGDRPARRIDLELRADDPLWPTAERRPGTKSRFVWLTLVEQAS